MEVGASRAPSHIDPIDGAISRVALARIRSTVARLTLEAIRTRLKAAGKRVRLDVKRTDTTRTAELALRTLI